jgi:hypothetical protein
MARPARHAIRCRDIDLGVVVWGVVDVVPGQAVAQDDDLAWHQSWLNLVRNITTAGKSIQRARVVTVPHVDYTRWGLTVAPHNIAAGEDIRWLPRHLIDADALPTDDYWLFDDNVVVFTVLNPAAGLPVALPRPIQLLPLSAAQCEIGYGRQRFPIANILIANTCQRRDET